MGCSASTPADHVTPDGETPSEGGLATEASPKRSPETHSHTKSEERQRDDTAPAGLQTATSDEALSDGTRHNSPLMREPPSPFGKQPASPFGGGDRSPVGSDLSSLGSPGFSNTSQTAMDPWSPPQKNFAADYHRPVQDSYSESKRGGFDPDAFRRANAKFDNSPDASRPDLDRSNLGGNYGGGGGNNNYGGGGGNNNYGGGFNGNAQNQWNQNQGGYQRSPDIFSAEAPLPSYGSRGPSERDIYSQSPDRAPTSPFDPKKGSKIGADDDLLMDDILGELDDI